MKVSLTLLVQKEIEFVNEDDYESQRDQIIDNFERDGWLCNVENEDDICRRKV